MPHPNFIVSEPVRKLKINFTSKIESSRFKRLKLWFFPTAVRKALENISPNQDSIDCTQLQIIYDALMNHTSFFQRGIFSCLRHFFDRTFGYSFKAAGNTTTLATPHYFSLIATHSNPDDISRALSSLIKVDLLTPENEEELLKFNINQLASIGELEHSGILTQENFYMVKNTSLPYFIVYGFTLLAKVGLYNPNNRALYLACEEVDYVYDAISWLTLKDLFWPIRPKGLLTQSNFNTIVMHHNIFGIELAMQELWHHGYTSIRRLTQSNFDKIIALANPKSLAYALKAMKYYISQKNLNFLFQHADILLTEEARKLWSAISERTLPTDFFKAIRPICEAVNLTLATRQQQFANYIQQLPSYNHPLPSLSDSESSSNINILQNLSLGIPKDVTFLDLSDQDFGSRSSNEFIDDIAALPRDLKSLCLSENYLSKHSGDVLAKVFSKLPPFLQSLDLSCNNLWAKSGSKLAKAFASLPSTLESINLSDNCPIIEDHQIGQLGDRLEKAFAALPLSLKFIELSNLVRYKSEKALTAIFAALPVHLKCLGLTSPFHENASNVAKALMTLHPGVIEINFSNASLHQIEDLPLFFAAIPRRLSSLNLTDNGLSYLSGDQLAELFIALPQNLATLNLSENYLFKYRSGEELSNAFAHLPAHLKSLDLSGNQLDAMNGNDLKRIFKALPQHLQHLNLANTRLHWLSGDNLQPAFTSIPKSVTSLNLSGNTLNLIKAKDLSNFVDSLPQVKTIYLEYDEVELMTIEQRTALMKIFPNLQNTIFLDAYGNAPGEVHHNKIVFKMNENKLSGVDLRKVKNQARKLGFPAEFPSLQTQAAFFVKYKTNIDLSNAMLPELVNNFLKSV